MKVIKEPLSQKAKCNLCRAEYEIEYTDYLDKKKCVWDTFTPKVCFICQFCKTANVEVVYD